MRTLAVGDIHGCRRSLEALAGYVGFADGDTIVTLGDYVDRDSRGVIDFLIGLGERCKLVNLLGNHEMMMQWARESREALPSWLGHGGEETLASYDADSFDAIPDAHWEFFASCHCFFQNETHFFVHANAYPDIPLEEQPDAMLYWEPFGSPEPHQSGKVMVCGHTSQKSGRPKDVGHAVCIDTWACGKGWLTCLDTGSGRYWQTNEAGERREGVLSSHREG